MTGADGRVPVTLLTGFLGSGKTTLLARLVRHPGAGRICAIINEFGDIDLDHDLIEASSEDMVLLGNGCLCCSIRGNLADTLRDLDGRRAAYGFDRIVVETSGLVDPTPVLALLLADETLARRFRLAGVVTVVDAVHGAQQIDTHGECLRQVALADRIVLSKTDLAPAGAVTDRLRAINPTVEIRAADHGAVDPDWVLAPAERDMAVDALPEPRNTGHDPRLTVISATCRLPLSPADRDATMRALESLAGPHLLRAKGILQILGEAHPLAVHAVQHIVHPLEPLPWHAVGAISRLVVIGWDVPAETIRAALPRCFRPAGAYADADRRTPNSRSANIG